MSDLIARGGFGRVERFLMGDGKYSARKTFSPAFAISSAAEYEKLKFRFAREVKVQSSIASKSFIPIISHDLTAAEPSYLMPLADRNFQQQIEIDRSNGTAPQSGLADILNALEELHQLGFVHRDLKPQNILLHEGIWKLTDFGLVLPPSSGTTKLTSMDSNWGTPMYCAPEQATDFRGSTPAVDIYAFGCILHDIYSNTPRVPYQRQTAHGAIGTIIEKCTEARPDKRFKTVQALRGTLLTLLASTPTIAPSPKASEWADSLKDISQWSLDKAYGLARFVSNNSDVSDLYVVFKQLDEDAINALFALDAEIWKFICLQYTEWVEGTAFDFGFCDVLAKRLELIFTVGDLECKGASILAAAELGRSHNRWFVMGVVQRLCGVQLDDNEAQRIAIEIKAADAVNNFVRCQEVMGGGIPFHPKIAAALS